MISIVVEVRETSSNGSVKPFLAYAFVILILAFGGKVFASSACLRHSVTPILPVSSVMSKEATRIFSP